MRLVREEKFGHYFYTSRDEGGLVLLTPARAGILWDVCVGSKGQADWRNGVRS